MTYIQGDIVIVPFPFSDQSNSKLRPAVVVSGPTMNKSSDVILAQITSKNKGNAFVFPINTADIETPLNHVSVVRCDKLVSTDKNLIRKKISKFHKQSIEALIEKVKTTFD